LKTEGSLQVEKGTNGNVDRTVLTALLRVALRDVGLKMLRKVENTNGNIQIEKSFKLCLNIIIL